MAGQASSSAELIVKGKLFHYHFGKRVFLLFYCIKQSYEFLTINLLELLVIENSFNKDVEMKIFYLLKLAGKYSNYEERLKLLMK